MMKNMAALVLAVSLLTPSLVKAEEWSEPSPAPAGSSEKPPSSGAGYITAGAMFTGLGVGNLLTAPLCKTGLISRDLQDGCLYGSLIVGGTFLLIGVPLLIAGAGERSKYNEWKAQQAASSVRPGPRVAGQRITYGGLGFSAAKGGGVLTFGGRF